MFNKILIANRGEIACRVIQTCKRLGIAAVAVYSDADRYARHVQLADEAWHIGGPRPADSYLRAENIILAAKASGANAIHPGYGFLSENADFARAVEASGLTFIGPTPDAIDAMGSKSAAKALMEKAGVPVVPGYHGDNQDPAFLANQANQVGYPLLIKAIAGGGGKGVRLVNDATEFLPQLEAAKRESTNAFGNDAVLLERFVQGPHHIEFQVFGDTHGNFVHLYERECSIQRRHQKILEETPSPFLDADMRKRMGDAAVTAARAINYRGAGTIEFIVGEDRQFFFMEMNTRLQVEHPVTEMVTGQDLVEWQLRVAAGEPLPLAQTQIPHQGHAIEVRLCAENPDNNFLPGIGTLSCFTVPNLNPYVRIDTGVIEGDSISVFYDPMIAKLIVYGEDRSSAIHRLQQALAETAIIGLNTNTPFLQKLVHHPAFIQGKTDTLFIERHREHLFAKPKAAPQVALIAAACRALHDAEKQAALQLRFNDDPTSPWHDNSSWRLNGEGRRTFIFFDPLAAASVEIHAQGKDGRYQFEIDRNAVTVNCAWSMDQVRLAYDNKRFTVGVVRYQDHFTVLLADTRYDLIGIDPFAFEKADEVPDGRLTALMPGRIVKILVAAGDKVKRGEPLLIMEAMKMEHTIHSPHDGVIERIAFKEGNIVEADAVLFAFARN
ncbi:MAG: acetyl/propionyl/methylcrotonyl-CoA carboxylase subunit alpha [Pseudomonadota bacterium]